MMTYVLTKKQQGFTLAELLVVMAMTGVVATAILSLYLNTQRTAVTSEEVVEVQQNIRIATERISKDLRMAGFMVPKQDPAITAAAATSLTLVTATAAGIAARVNTGLDVVVGDDNEFFVTYPEMVDLFEVDDVVRILRTPSQNEPFPGTLIIEALDRTTNKITLSGFTASANYQPGDVIVRTTASAPNPNTVQYCLGPATGCGLTVTTCPAGQTCLMRVANGTASVIANNMTPGGLQFSYILDDGREPPLDASPTLPLSTVNLQKIKAVRLTISGQTATSVPLSDAPKVRSLTSVISLRNR